MNRLLMAKKSKCIIVICELLNIFEHVDVIKICYMTQLLLQDETIKIKHINDFFNVLSLFQPFCKEETRFVFENLLYLEKCNAIKIQNCVVSKNNNNNITSYFVSDEMVDVLNDINKLSVNAFLRMVMQYA